MRCPYCNFDNDPKARFCENCRKPLVKVCSNCGKDNSLGAKFCIFCGSRMKSERSFTSLLIGCIIIIVVIFFILIAISIMKYP